jgi:hypothetical protein
MTGAPGKTCAKEGKPITKTFIAGLKAGGRHPADVNRCG